MNQIKNEAMKKVSNQPTEYDNVNPPTSIMVY